MRAIGRGMPGRFRCAAAVLAMLAGGVAQAALPAGATAASGAPAISSNPVGVTACSGASAAFTTAGSGNPSPSVQWQVLANGSTTWVDDTTDAGATTDTLTVAASLDLTAENQYRAVFTNSAGSATTTAATLDVPWPIDSAPTDQWAVTGQSATFTVVRNACYPSAPVQWQMEAAGSSTYTDISGATSSSLTIPTVSSAQDGVAYQAVVHVGPDAILSGPAIVRQFPLPAPTSAVVGPGATATFSVQGIPLFNTGQWQVSSDGGATWSNDTTDATSSTNGFTLTVTGAALAQSGEQFRVLITNASGGSVATPPATLTVTTGAYPVVTTQPLTTDVCYGLPATFTAASTGTPAPTIQWQVSTDGGATWSDDTTDAGATTSMLSVNAVRSGQQYRALFTNVYGTNASLAATLYVSYPPPIVALPQTDELLTGQTVTLTASVSAACYQSLPLQWQYAPAGTSPPLYSDIPGATTSTLTLPNATPSQNGSYKPRFGAAQPLVYASTVTLYPVPVPAAQTVAAGQTATFSAIVTGPYLPSGWSTPWQTSSDGGTTWKNDSTDAGATTQTLTVAGVTAAQSGTDYRAAITDSAGTVDTPAATLRVPTTSRAPTVTGITPSSGGAFTLVIITGTNLSGAKTVSFGGHRARFLPLGNRLALALAPPGPTGTADVTVTTKYGTSATGAADRFTYR